MDNKIYCSTGTSIGRANNYDYRKIIEIAPYVDTNEYELMMLNAYYEKLSEIPRDFIRAGLSFPVTHADKMIGELLSRGGEDDAVEAVRRFKLNCGLAQALNSKKLVLHLWGGVLSDCSIKRNIDICDVLLNIAQKYRLRLTIENIPCACVDPLSHWKTLAERYGELDFIFDTRFGAFHRQNEQVFSDGWFNSGRITHMHVSDLTGPPMDFKTLRPILHPGEGIVDFDTFFKKIAPLYDGGITLESPVLALDGSLDIDKLNKSINYIRKRI